MQSYNDDGDKGYILEVNTSYSKHLQKIHRNLQLWLEAMDVGKFQKLVRKMFDKKNYVVHT